MGAKNVVVLGAGPAGLACSLTLARAGHRVTILERDPAEMASDPFQWERKGVPHFAQPHMLIPRACKELRECFPDVYELLLAEGASEIDLRPRLQAAEPTNVAQAGDDDLRYLAVRRAVLEGALRRAALSEPGIEIRFGTDVEGLVFDPGAVVGARTSHGDIPAQVVVDALGRRSPIANWLDAGGYAPPSQEHSPCGVIYYSRYYRVRPGMQLPGGPWLLGPRGDLGFMGYATFPGDNDTFAALLSIPTDVPTLKVFKDADVFDAAVAKIPALARWVDPALVEAITPVLPMAGLTNTLHRYGATRPSGLFSVGDAISHTDPTLAHGIAFLLIHARALTKALADHDEPHDAATSFTAATETALRERFTLATAVGAQRHRGWTGAGVDVAHHDGDYALFSVAALGAAAMVDPMALRIFVRRMGLLDSTEVFDCDIDLQLHVERVFAELLTRMPPVPGPSQADLLSIGTS